MIDGGEGEMHEEERGKAEAERGSERKKRGGVKEMEEGGRCLSGEKRRGK